MYCLNEIICVSYWFLLVICIISVVLSFLCLLNMDKIDKEMFPMAVDRDFSGLVTYLGLASWFLLSIFGIIGTIKALFNL